VPATDQERRRWLEALRASAGQDIASRYREKLIERYGPARGSAIQYAEAFEACEYGARLSPERLQALFPVKA